MNFRRLAAATVALALVSTAASAQGLVGGAEIGARRGEAEAGPVGAIVGGALGAAVGAVNGVLGVDARPRVREYVVREARPAYSWNGEIRVGTVLPPDVALYPVPPELGADRYRYAVVGSRAVLVDPDNGRVVEILD